MYDIIVVGAGPAGMTAALYALRAGKTVLVIEKENIGGQITYSPHVENYPALGATSGLAFADALYEQIDEHGAEIEFETVTSVKTDGKIKQVFCGDKKYEAKAVIIAAGSKHRKLGIDREDELTGRGVSYCAVCDGAFFKGKTVAVCGGGNTALQDAIYLAEGCAKVYLIHRRDAFRGDVKLVEKLKSLENVEFVTPAVIKKLDGENALESIIVTAPDGTSERRIELDGLFAAIGQMPENDAFADIIELDEAGYAASGEDCRTKTEGVFVAGDCRRKSVRQLTTAVGDGAAAAVTACEYIEML